MLDNDYIILVDENGQPYIAHSVFTKARDAVKSAGRSAHKYVAKIGEGAKARYFYTQEELKAFYNRGKAAAGKAAEAVRGAATKAATTAKSAASSVSKYASDRLGDVSDFVHRRNKANKALEPYEERNPDGSYITNLGKYWERMGYVDDWNNMKAKLKNDSHTAPNDPRLPRQIGPRSWLLPADPARAEHDTKSHNEARSLESSEHDSKSKKRSRRGKANEIAENDPNIDVKGKADNRNNSVDADGTYSKASIDKLASQRNGNNRVDPVLDDLLERATHTNSKADWDAVYNHDLDQVMRKRKGYSFFTPPYGGGTYAVEDHPYNSYDLDKAASKKKKKK